MRDKYLDLLNQAKAATKVDIVDEKLRKGYEEANKQPAEGADSVQPPAAQPQQ